MWCASSLNREETIREETIDARVQARIHRKTRACDFPAKAAAAVVIAAVS
jgi:hypothetical protein